MAEVLGEDHRVRIPECRNSCKVFLTKIDLDLKWLWLFYPDRFIVKVAYIEVVLEFCERKWLVDPLWRVCLRCVLPRLGLNAL